MGGGRIIRDKLWFYSTYRQIGAEQHGARHVGQQERRQPERLDGRFRPEPAGVQTTPGAKRDRAPHVAGDAAQQVQPQLVGADTTTRTAKGGGTATTTIEATQPDADSSRRASRTPRWSSPLTSRLLRRPAGARTRRGIAIPQPRTDGTHNPRMIRAQEQARSYGIPNLTSRMPARRGRRLQSSSDRDAWRTTARRSRTSPARTT